MEKELIEEALSICKRAGHDGISVSLSFTVGSIHGPVNVVVANMRQSSASSSTPQTTHENS